MQNKESAKKVQENCVQFIFGLLQHPRPNVRAFLYPFRVLSCPQGYIGGQLNKCSCAFMSVCLCVCVSVCLCVCVSECLSVCLSSFVRNIALQESQRLYRLPIQLGDIIFHIEIDIEISE